MHLQSTMSAEAFVAIEEWEPDLGLTRACWVRGYVCGWLAVLHWSHCIHEHV